MNARLVYVMGPSGAGKDSLLAWLRQRLPATGPLHWAQRTISRPLQQPGTPGTEQHESVSPATFAALRDAQAFALHWHANGLGYGVRHAQLAPLLQGQWVLVNGSRAHLPQALAAFASLLPVHITASPQVLRERLLARGRETPAEVDARVQRAQAYQPPAGVARIEVHNDSTLESAGQQLLAALQQVPGWPVSPVLPGRCNGTLVAPFAQPSLTVSASHEHPA